MPASAVTDTQTGYAPSVGLPRHATSPPHTAQPARRAGTMARAVAVAHAAVPRGGVRDGVLLWVLLPGAGLLWDDLPRDGATGPPAARDRQASVQRRRPARSPGPPTGLPREMSPPRPPGCVDETTVSRHLDRRQETARYGLLRGSLFKWPRGPFSSCSYQRGPRGPPRGRNPGTRPTSRPGRPSRGRVEAVPAGCAAVMARGRARP